MLEAYVFIMTIVLPTGEIVANASAVDICPAVEVVNKINKLKIDNNEILDWRAACVQVEFDKGILNKT